MCFRICSDFECDNEFDNSSGGNETTCIYEQNPVCNGYFVASDLNDVLEWMNYDNLITFYESPPTNDNVDKNIDEVIKLVN